MITPELLSKYDRPGPRYTSYPTAPVWTDAYDGETHAATLSRSAEDPNAPMSVYVHLPFCRSMCWFCGCNVVITQDGDKAERYVDDVLVEARLARKLMGTTRPVLQHHWGGGTPTFLTPDQIRRLFRGLCEIFPLGERAEVSIEVDPRVTTTDHLDALREVGFNRLSMGVQDFDPVVQEAIHRIQGFELTSQLIESARERGFESINVDLIYGLPHQSAEGFAKTVDQVIAIRPDRLACYGYAHVPWLKKHQSVIDEATLPTGAEKLGLYLTAYEKFEAAGYEAIGMDHFALSTDELAIAANERRLHRNFMGYATMPGEDMLGLGATSISEMHGCFAQNVKGIKEWSDAVHAGRLAIERGHARSEDDSARRRIILDLMCHFRLDYADHGGAAAFRERYATELSECGEFVGDGLVEMDDEGITVTRRGRCLVRNVAMVFDAWLRRSRQDKPAGPRFSRTV